MPPPTTPQTPNSKRFWGDEKNLDSIYAIYMKKINYSYNNNSNNNINESTSKELPTNSLQWETRQIRVLQAATLDHVIKFILLINNSNDETSPNDKKLNRDSHSPIDGNILEDERNNVVHIIHVLFCTYRIYRNPYELMLKLMDYSDLCRIEQYRFVMHYWMDNYPEDYEYPVIDNQSQMLPINNDKQESMSDDKEDSGSPLVIEFLRLNRDEYLKGKALKLNELRSNNLLNNSNSSTTKRRNHNTSSHHHNLSETARTSAVLEFDSRFMAQQLTAIDLETFLSIKPHSLLEGTKADKRVQRMVKNFNLLSRQVVVTILKSRNPHVVATHWIAVAMNLRKIKNFNSLKAIIAGLTNESIHRLKQNIWNKLDRTSMANFKLMASIVDDVNNQTVLRQTQLVVEGTAKMNMEDDSLGTIPYLGTFLTDLTMIDARYPSYVPSPKDDTSRLKLINFEKCVKQFEILTQVQLLQKNVLASLHAIQRRNHFDEQSTLNRTKLDFNPSSQILMQAKPAIPQVSRLFENWFNDDTISSMTDKQWLVNKQCIILIFVILRIVSN